MIIMIIIKFPSLFSPLVQYHHHFFFLFQSFIIVIIIIIIFLSSFHFRPISSSSSSTSFLVSFNINFIFLFFFSFSSHSIFFSSHFLLFWNLILVSFIISSDECIFFFLFKYLFILSFYSASVVISSLALFLFIFLISLFYSTIKEMQFPCKSAIVLLKTNCYKTQRTISHVPRKFLQKKNHEMNYGILSLILKKIE